MAVNFGRLAELVGERRSQVIRIASAWPKVALRS
jgi:hypothetical protein